MRKKGALASGIGSKTLYLHHGQSLECHMMWIITDIHQQWDISQNIAVFNQTV